MAIVQIRQELHFLLLCLRLRQAIIKLCFDRPENLPPTLSFILTGNIQPVLNIEILRPVGACTNTQLRVLTFPATQAFSSLSASRTNWRCEDGSSIGMPFNSLFVLDRLCWRGGVILPRHWTQTEIRRSSA